MTIEPVDRQIYSAIFAQYMSEIHTLQHKMEKLHDECCIIFCGTGIIDVIYYLEEAESCCKQILEQLNDEPKEQTYFS